MLRPLTLLAGLLLLGLLVFVLLQKHGAAPASTPVDPGIVRPEDRRSEPLTSIEAAARDEAGVPAAPDGKYVSIVGKLTREEDGTPVEGAVATFTYRYLSKGAQAELRKVPVDVDEHGHFEQVFSEPVQLSLCRIEPAEAESSELAHESVRRADFVRAVRPLDVRVDSRGVTVPLLVNCGLEITGRVFDVHTNESQANALVFAMVDFDLLLGARTNSNGVFRLRGIDPVLSQPGREYVQLVPTGPDTARGIDDLRLVAKATAHRPASRVVSLPLQSSRPTHIDIPVASGVRVAGKVLDFSGKPVPRARVDVIGPADPNSNDPHEAVRVQATLTDADGKFEFETVELTEGCEIRAQHPSQPGPAPHVALGNRQVDRPLIVLTLPDTQSYRIQVRDTDGALLDARAFSVRLRDVWGERIVDGSDSVPMLQVWAAVGARTALSVTVKRWENKVEIIRHAQITLEPLAQTPEPETVTLDLEP